MPEYDALPVRASPPAPAVGDGPRKITGSVANDREAPTPSEAYKLRASVRSCTASDRTRGCGIRNVSAAGPGIEVVHASNGTRTRWMGTLTCGHRWTCPVCARKIVAKRRVQITDALAAGRIAEPERAWRMLTLTIRHHRGDPLLRQLRGLRNAWRRTRQRGSVQRLWKANVAASVRAVEITRGKNGWHSHLHVLILSSEWTAAERLQVQFTWRAMVTRELGSDCAPDELHGVCWSRDVDDRYLAKLGLEATGAAKKNSAWALADAANEHYAIARRMRDKAARAASYADGDRERAIFREYETSTKGCRAIELDDRAAALARSGETSRHQAGARLDGSDEDQHDVASYEIPMGGSVQTRTGPIAIMRALALLERSDRSILREALDVAARAPPTAEAGELAVRAWLAERIAVLFPYYGDEARMGFCA